MPDLPPAATALFQQAVQRMGGGDAAGAARLFADALRLAPGLAEAHANLGWLHAQAGRADEAEAAYRRAIALAPGLMPARLNLGALLLLERRRLAEAEACYRAALAHDEASAAAWTGLGVVLACRRHDAEAEACHRRAIALQPGYRMAHFNLTYLLLRQGRWDEGWAALEFRDSYEALARHMADAGLPRWQGEPLAGRALLIGIEGGHGDMIQLVRYAALAKARGAACVGVLCQPALQRLFARHPAVDHAIALDAPVPPVEWDVWLPAMSLPGCFGTRVDAVPAELPYLSAEPARIAHWDAVLGPRDGRRRIGLVWHGHPGHENDAQRSLPGLAVLAPLARVPGVQWLSLQMPSPGTEARDAAELAASPLPLTDLGARTGDLLDAAALLMNLDLLISVDSAYAHLAGALNRPCWLLLSDFKTDWRWLDGRADTPWYPGALRLFRQDATQRWEPVVASVAEALSSFSG